MTDTAEPREFARKAAEMIRQLNHATLEPKQMQYASEVSKTVLALIDLVDRLPQTLSQLEAGLRAVELRDGIRLDHDGDVQVEVETAAQALQAASAALDLVRQELAAASAPLFHMGAPYTPDDEYDED